MISSKVQKLKREVASTRQATEKLLVELKSLERELLTVRDDSQLANMELQQKIQVQSRMFQSIASISRKMHDTAQASIRNIRA